MPVCMVKKNDEHRRPFEPEVADKNKFPWNTESLENMKFSEREPRVLSSWFPTDMNNPRFLMQGKDEKRNQNQHIEDGERQLSNPIIWMPSDNVQREAEKDQREMNDWLPLEMDRLKSLMQGQDEKRKANQQNQDRMRQFPYPIFWMPFKSEQGDTQKQDEEVNAASASAEEQPSAVQCFLVKPSESDDSMKKSETPRETGQANNLQVMESTAKQKSIPVKQVEVHKEESSYEGGEKKVAAEISSGSNKQRQPLSPPKASKLPPVCLRLEPLPRNKDSKGKSRSPSPPGMKGQSQEDTPKSGTSPSLKEETPRSTQSSDVSLKAREEVEPKKVEERDNIDDETCENKNGYLRSGSQTENASNWSFGSQEIAS